MKREVTAKELYVSALTKAESVTAVQLFAVRSEIRKLGFPVERVDFHRIHNTSGYYVKSGRLHRGEKFSPVEISEDIKPAFNLL